MRNGEMSGCQRNPHFMDSLFRGTIPKKDRFMCEFISTLWLRFKDWIVKSKVFVLDFYPRMLGGFPVDFLLAIAVPIGLGVFPMTGGFKVFFLAFLAAILAELAWRMPLPRRGKIVASIMVIVATIALGYRPVVDQFNTDAIFRDYKKTRDLLAKFQAHDESLKMIVEQYDRLNSAQSLFDSMGGKTDENQRAEINIHTVEDLKDMLKNFDAIATPAGNGLRIKLGLNMYRVIYPVPMRAVPKLSFSGLPHGVTATIIEPSNLGFTVLFLPLSVSVDHFDLIADAEL
jgi:hypothetical protein